MSAIDIHEPDDATPMAQAARIAAMLDHPTLAVAVVERGHVRRSNAAWNALFAWRTDVSVESHLISLFPSANSADRFERALIGELDAQGRHARVEHMLVKRDGVAFMAEAVVQLLDGSGGRDGLAADAIWQVRDVTTERELRREIRELEEYYRALATYQWDLTFVVDRRDCLTFASSSVETALGYRPPVILGEPFSSLLATDGATAAMQWLRASRQEDGRRPRESHHVRVLHRDGETRILSCRVRNCIDVPRIAGLVINARDVTEEVREQQAARAAEERAKHLRERLFDLAGDATDLGDARIASLLRATLDALQCACASYWAIDEFDGTLTSAQSVGGSAERLDGQGVAIDPTETPAYASAMQAGRPIVVEDVDGETAPDAIPRSMFAASNTGAMLDYPVATGGRMVGRLAIEHADGPRHWRTDEIDFGGGIALLVALALEGAEREEAAGVSATLTLSDALTGLANRSSAEAEVERRIEDARMQGRTLAAVAIDLDGFRDVNDGHGYAMGDALLAAVGAVVGEVAGPDAFVARMGGDEFFVLRPELARGATDAVLHRLVERLASETLVEELRQHVGASIGVARFPADADDPQALFSAADLALAEAKRRGGSQVFAFDGALAERMRLDRELDTQIEEALARDEFRVFYQPQIELASGRIVGLEALLRWQHPSRGLLLPDAFIHVALHHGMIDTLTKWVFTQVCEHIVAWRRTGHFDEAPVSVNVTGRQFHDRRLPAIVASALMKSALPARALMIEVTEATLKAADEATARVIGELSRLGVRFSLADFCFDADSVDVLRRVPIAQVKIDRHLVRGLPDDRAASVIVAAIVQSARQLEYQVIAEGVETAAQIDVLRAQECDAGQGYHVGAPLAATDMQQFLTRSASPSPP